jgi:RHS repeat-associated protein
MTNIIKINHDSPSLSLGEGLGVRMKKILSLFVLLPIMVVGQTQTENYIKTKTYKVPTTTSIATPTITQANQNVTYFDGLGRPIQQVAHQQSGTGEDLVTPIAYDGFGRQDKDYLPYVPTTSASLDYKPSALTEVNTFYNTVAYENTTNPYSQKLFEASPLNRVLKQAAPGNDWALGKGHEIKLDYQTNTASEVKLFSATATWNLASGLYDISLGNATATVFYAANQLYKTITYDENTAATPTETNGSTLEFKDKEGQVVLKRTYETGAKHDTYYVYDQYGNLTYVIPPKADAAITQAILDDLCYQYKYDYRNRLVEKKLPGKQWEFIVYDKLDRVVATGPAFSPFSDITTIGWLITKYDALNRVVFTGWENTSASSTTRASKQTNQNNLTTTLNESKGSYYGTTTDNIPTIYSNGVAPTSFKLLSVNYYDDYSIPNILIFPTSTAVQGLLYKQQGLNTGTWTRILTTTASVSGEISATFYDAKARPIRTTYQNYLGGYTYIDSKLDAFSGRLNFTETRHKRVSGNVELYIKEVFTYTDQDRLLTHTHQINGGAIALLASNTYDELGQLISKNVGNSTAAPLQKVDYAYNIRGWLTGINNDQTNNLILNVTEKDLFAFKINYNTTENCTNYTGTALYNGNISETYWRSASDNVERKYGYKYDNLNRLRESIYQKPGLTTAQTLVTNAYDENIAYDKNGNITSLNRKGNGDPQIGATLIDDLTYVYMPTSSNQLLKVTDGLNGNDAQGFIDANKTDDYSYDANGNMIADANKGITELIYNHLNLPIKITFGTKGIIEYLYNASGVKIKKIVKELPQKKSPFTTITTTDYLSGFQYLTSTLFSTLIKTKPAVTNLQFFPHLEGYVACSLGVFSYIYQYKDHLGNVRLSYQDKNNNRIIDTGEIMEENNYYAFGLKHKGYNEYSPTSNKYKYNGKELQEELGLNMYDYGARNYDPAIGRWMNIDPLASKFPDQSPYSFVFNNPMRFVDPDGRAPVDWFKNAAGKVVWFDNTSKGFTDTNGGKWTNVGSNLNEVKQSLNVPTESQNTNWNTLTAFVSSGKDGAGKGWGIPNPITFNNAAQVTYDLNVANKGANGELISGKTEVTGVSVNARVSSETFAPGMQITGVSGNFGVEKWTPTGLSLTSKSNPFQDYKGQMLSSAPFHATSEATMNLSLSTYKNLTNTSSGVSTGLNLQFNTYTTTKNLQSSKQLIFNTSN